MRFKITCFVDQKYFEVSRNWIAAMNHLGLLESVLLVALDRESQLRLQSLRLPNILRPHDCRDLGGLWIHRLRVLNELLADGLSLVHSDADAVWLANPMQDWLASGCDLLFTQGTDWPKSALATRRFVACCGLYFVANNPYARAFMEKLLHKTIQTRDDQVALNALLPRQFTDWNVEHTRELAFRGKPFTVSNQLMWTRRGELKFGILPHHLYPRIDDTHGDGASARMAHPVSDKEAGETIQVLKSKALWFLDK